MPSSFSVGSRLFFVARWPFKILQHFTYGILESRLLDCISFHFNISQTKLENLANIQAVQYSQQVKNNL